MSNMIAVEIAGVLAAWTVVGFAIWRWGPGMRRHSVYCPEKKVRATVVADQREAEFGCLRVVDVTACSLPPAQPLACGRACLGHL